MIGFLTIIISFFPLFHFSLKNCPYSTPLAIKINLNDSLSGKQNCLNDETCCFMRVQYSEYVGGFQGTACLPVDYEKNTSSYNYSFWQALALTFCDDAKILARNWSNIDYIEDCECGYKESNFSNFINFGVFLILLSVSVVIF